MDTPTSAAGQRVGYARVSSSDQRLDRQIAALGQVDKLFTDQLSGGSRAQRQGLADLLSYVRAGDEVVVASMDRLARSVRDLRDLVDEITTKGATVRFIQEVQVYRPSGADPMSDLLLNVLGSVAEFERALIRERQAEGIAAARQRGVYARRRPPITAEMVTEIHRLVDEGVPKTRIAARVGISRAAVYRVLDGTYTAAE